MLMLKDALPYLVLDLESALAHLGRGNVATQLRQMAVERWSYDELADTAYLYLRSPRAPGAVEHQSAAEPPGETVSLYDELGVNVDTDSLGNIAGIEILGGNAIIAQLEQAVATWPRSP